MNENTPVADVLEATIQLYTKSKKKPGHHVLYNKREDSYCVLGAITAAVTNREKLETDPRAAQQPYPTKRFKNLTLIRKTARFLWNVLKEEAEKHQRYWNFSRFSWKTIYDWNDALIGGGSDYTTGEHLPTTERRKRFLTLLRRAQKEAAKQGV